MIGPMNVDAISSELKTVNWKVPAPISAAIGVNFKRGTRLLRPSSALLLSEINKNFLYFFVLHLRTISRVGIELE